MPRDGGARDAVDLDVARRGELDADLLEAEAGRVGDGADGEQGVRPLDRAAVDERDDDAVGRALARSRRGTVPSTSMPRLRKTSSMTVGGVGVLAGQHAVAGGDQHDLEPRPR